MARKSIDERIAAHENRAKALKVRKTKQDRAKETRSKILIGAFILHRLNHDGDIANSRRLGDWLRRGIPGFISRESDKKMILELLKEPEESPGTCPAKVPEN